MKHLVVCMLLALAGPVFAVKPVTLSTNRLAERATVFSTSHRYAVSGCPAARGVEIAAWAEDVEQRLSRFLGVAIPPGDPLPVVIRLVDDPDTPRGRVVRTQSFDAGMLSQRLEMINPASADQEDLLEGLCWLLINRTVLSRQPDSVRNSDPVRAPDWLAVGAAQNLFPEARQRNEKIAIELWKKGRGHKLTDLVTWNFLPAGRWDEKSESGVFMAFMLHPSVAAKRTAMLLAQLEAGDPLSADFVAQRVIGSATVADVEKARDTWLAGQADDIVPGVTGNAAERAAELVRLLDIRPQEYGLPDSDKIPPIVDPKEMIRRRNESWVPLLADRVGMKARMLGVGQPPEFQRVVAGYVGFLDAMAGRKKGFTGGLFGGGASAASLQKLLDQAQTSLIDYQVAQKQREKFIEQSDGRPAVPEPTATSADPAVRDYLDRIELLTTPPKP